ncbi:MAG TPA: EamA family transporter, partial [Burkholderiales bacterium]|nr:EamA family transporter [Burkholderiales bacterium]
LAGIFMITMGAFLLNLRHLGKGIFEPFRAVLKESGSRLMLLVAFLYGITSVLGKGALAYCPPLTFGAFYFGLLGLISLPLAGRAYGAVLSRPVWPLLIGLMVSVMAASHFLALGETNVAYMIAVKRTSLLFGLVYGAVLFKEKGFGLHFVAGLFMVTGVAMISAMAK